MIKGLQIRRMTPSDLKGVFELGQDSPGIDFSGRPWTTDHVSDVLASSIDFSLAAVRRNSILGFIIPKIKADGDAMTGEIIWLCAIEQFSEEIESALVKELISVNNEITCWEIKVKKNNSSKYNILQKNGFVDNGEFIHLKMDLKNRLP